MPWHLDRKLRVLPLFVTAVLHVLLATRPMMRCVASFEIESKEYQEFVDGGSRRGRRLLMASEDFATTTAAGIAQQSGSIDGAALSSKFNGPRRLAGSNGKIYVTETFSKTIRVYDPEAGTVSFLAGNTGTSGFVDGTGTGATFNNPRGMDVDSDNHLLYVADNANHAIRSIGIYSGIVTTVAGTGSPGFSDNPSAVLGELDQPEDVALLDGFLYIADHGNHKVRSYNLQTMELSTLAGDGQGYQDGTTATALFNNPAGITVSGTTLYVADKTNNRIRYIETQTLAVGTLCGDGQAGNIDGTGISASITQPYEMALLGKIIYFVEYLKHAIKRVDIDTGEVTTVAGQIGVQGYIDGVGIASTFDTPLGVAITKGKLYVADYYNHMIRSVAIPADVLTVAGTPGLSGQLSTLLNTPCDLALTGNKLYISQFQVHTIKMLDLDTGLMTDEAGIFNTAGFLDNATATDATFDQPRGLAFDDNTNTLYIADTNNHAIRAYVPNGGVTTVAGNGTAGHGDAVGTFALFNDPEELLLHETMLYISDRLNHVIRAMNLTSMEVITLAGVPTTGGYIDGSPTTAKFKLPSGLAMSPGMLYVSERGNDAIRTIDLETMDVGTLCGGGAEGDLDGIGTDAQLTNPHYLAISGPILYFTELFLHSIKSVNIHDRQVTTVAGQTTVFGTYDGSATDALFDNTGGMAVLGTSLYVADTGNEIIREVKIPAEVSTVAGSTASAFGSEGGAGTIARFYGPQYLAMSSDDSVIYISEAQGHRIRALDRATLKVESIVGNYGFFGTADGAGTNANFYSPGGLVVNGSTLYVADTMNHKIRSIDVTNPGIENTQTRAGSSSGASGMVDDVAQQARFNEPTGLAMWGTTLYVSDALNHAIRAVDTTNWGVTTVAGSLTSTPDYVDDVGTLARFNQPKNLAISTSDIMYISDSANKLIRTLDLVNLNVGTLCGSQGVSGSADGIGASAQFETPAGLAINGSTLYVGDLGSAIRAVNIDTQEVTTYSGKMYLPAHVDGSLDMARFSEPAGLVIFGTTIFVADQLGHSIRAVEAGLKPFPPPPPPSPSPSPPPSPEPVEADHQRICGSAPACSGCSCGVGSGTERMIERLRRRVRNED